MNLAKQSYIDGINLDLFDRVEVYRPDLGHIRKIVYVPEKVIFINRAAEDNANVIKLSYDEQELLEMLMEGGADNE